MTDQIVPAGQTGPTLTEVAHRESNELYDVIALLHAVEDRVDDLYLAATATDEQKLYSHQTLRLAQMARAKVQATIDALDPHI